MSEETNPTPPPIKLIVVCGHCYEHCHDGAALEFNFRDKMVYFVCPKCRKSDSMGLRPKTAQPLPRTKLSR